MKSPVTKDYLDSLRQKLIDAEEANDRELAGMCRDEYRQACASAYSSGILVFKSEVAGSNPAHNIGRATG